MTATQRWRARKKAGLPIRRWVYRGGLSKDMKAYMKWYKKQKR